jgi:hypothetical protein
LTRYFFCHGARNTVIQHKLPVFSLFSEARRHNLTVNIDAALLSKHLPSHRNSRATTRSSSAPQFPSWPLFTRYGEEKEIYRRCCIASSD